MLIGRTTIMLEMSPLFLFAGKCLPDIP